MMQFNLNISQWTCFLVFDTRYWSIDTVSCSPAFCLIWKVICPGVRSSLPLFWFLRAARITVQLISNETSSKVFEEWGFHWQTFPRAPVSSASSVEYLVLFFSSLLKCTLCDNVHFRFSHSETLLISNFLSLGTIEPGYCATPLRKMHIYHFSLQYISYLS